MKKIKIEINPTEFPDTIRHLIRGATVYDSSCSSKASVYYLDTGYYIKADLYWAIWSLQYNLKTNAYTDLFLDSYGRENFNEDMLPVVAAFELFG